MSETQVATEAPQPVTVVEAPKPSIEQTMSEVYDKNYPDSRVARDRTSGEFKSKESAVEAVPEVKAEGAEVSDTAPETTQEPTTETVEPEETPAIDMPASWAADRKGVWDTLSPEARQIVAERESQAQSKLSELGRAVKATETVRPFLEPLERLAHQRGVQPGEVIQRLLAANDFLERDPRAALQWLANAHRIDLSQLAPQPIDPNNPESAQYGALTRELSEVKRQLAETTHRMTARETAEMQAREQTLTSSVEKFAEGKDYWPEIENEVFHQILALKAKDPARVQAEPMVVLKEAEERAIKLTPSVQDKLDKAARTEADKKAKEEAKKKADDAKRLASINVRSTTGSNPKPTFKSFEDEMAQVYDRLQATG
jgi:hypothetical protein